MSNVLDCVIPAHDKDFDTLGHTLSSIRRCCPEVRRIIVISSVHWDDSSCDGVETIGETDPCWPFSLADFDGCDCRPGWLFQQLIKLYAATTIQDIAPNILVCDADVVWTQGQQVHFLVSDSSQALPAAKYCTFTSDTCPPIRSSVDLHRYDDFVTAMVPDLTKPVPEKETAVCHHAIFQRHILNGLFERVQSHAKKLFWVAFKDAAQSCQGRASEYELYNAFARQYFPECCVPRPLAFAVVGDFKAALEKPPPVDFFVAHSHLRVLDRAELHDREGIINGNVQQETLRRFGQQHSQELASLLVGSGMF